MRIYALIIAMLPPVFAFAAGCENAWIQAASQTLSLDSAISFALTNFGNGERHFSVIQGSKTVDVYYLKGAVLIKGYPQAEVEKLPENTILMMPMVFVVPAGALARAVPQGECNVEHEMEISTQLDGKMQIQGRKLTKAQGRISRSTPSELSYQLDITIDPPDPDKTSIRYEGSMSFAQKQEKPDDETDISGYLLIGRTGPPQRVGASGIPSKLGDLRRFLETTQVRPNVPLHIAPTRK